MGYTPLEPTGAEAMIALVRKNQVEIGRLKADHEGLSNEKKEEQKEIRDRYHTTISELQTQERHMLRNLEKEIDASQTKLDKDVGELSDAKAKIDRIITLLRAEQKKLATEQQEKISNHRDRHLEIVESLTDDCIDLRLLIFENDRPKNKYSVGIVGTSKIGSWNYGENILELPHKSIWGLTFYGNIEYVVTHLPTLDEARKYAKARNIRKMLKDFFERYDKVHEEYQQVCQKYTLKDFADILEEWFKIYWTRSLRSWDREDKLKKHQIGTDDIEKMTPKQLVRLMKATGYGY